MSAKWRALQHRHRYTYSAIVFPSSFTASLSQSSLVQCCPKFYSHIGELVSMNSIYAQVNHAKKVVASFGEVLATTHEVGGETETVFVREAIRCFLEVLFMENSLPLHRTFVSALAKTRQFHSVISSCFRELCDEYGSLDEGGKRFCVSRVALSVFDMPKLGYLVDIVEDCALLVGYDIVSGLNGVILETEACARPPPTVMEQCQEALSCSYYLFQRFPLKFKGLVAEDASFMERVFGVQISILKSAAFSRDCYVAAGVSFCSALQICLKDEELGLFIAQGIFCWSESVLFPMRNLKVFCFTLPQHYPLIGPKVDRIIIFTELCCNLVISLIQTVETLLMILRKISLLENCSMSLQNARGWLLHCCAPVRSSVHRS